MTVENIVCDRCGADASRSEFAEESLCGRCGDAFFTDCEAAPDAEAHKASSESGIFGIDRVPDSTPGDLLRGAAGRLP